MSCLINYFQLQARTLPHRGHNNREILVGRVSFSNHSFYFTLSATDVKYVLQIKKRRYDLEICQTKDHVD